MDALKFTNYKDFIREKIHALPKRGHGQNLKIAKLLGIHTTMVTHIFKGDSNLSTEQALKLAEYFALPELETDYFVTLVQQERAANSQSRKYFEKQLKALRSKAQDLSSRLVETKVLDEKDQAVFYSAWYYSGIRLLTATAKFESVQAISEKINLPLQTVAKVVEFLISRGLLKQEHGIFVIGETKTYVTRDSDWVTKHHLNWRLKSIEQLDHVPDDDLVYTNPITISEKDFFKVREEVVKFIEKFRSIADPSPSEQLCVLNIDWRKLRILGE